MAAILGFFLNSTEHALFCESAGIGESAMKGGSGASFAVTAAKRIGLDISGHRRRHVDSLDLSEYDLVVTASDEIAGVMIEKGVEMKKIYNAQVSNPWPVQFQEDYDTTFSAILLAMYRVVTRYFS
ncbi:hypothetical protein L0244_18870 [bacterium]|nr:hypothetical protein [bacterium]